MILFRATKYLNYILLSRHKRGHGIHSPFVFDLVSRVFRNKPDPAVVFSVEQLRKRMISDKRTILVNDLGSGSGVHRNNLRRVSDIARRATVSGKYGRLLSNMATEFGKPLIIELGTSLGISTMYMAASNPTIKVLTIEGCAETASIAKQNFVEAGLNNILISGGPFDQVLQSIIDTGVKPGLVFIDGDHRKEPLFRYFNQLSKIADDKTVIIIDDIYNSKEMGEAWNELKLHENVSLSVDIYRMGMLFFREMITHNSYRIRY